MPDHFHALVVPETPQTISQLMQTVKGFSAREINKSRSSKGRVWQTSFYDRVIRNEDQLEATLAYIEANPVEAGFVARAEDYAWSSAHPASTTDLETWLTG